MPDMVQDPPARTGHCDASSSCRRCRSQKDYSHPTHVEDNLPLLVPVTRLAAADAESNHRKRVVWHATQRSQLEHRRLAAKVEHTVVDSSPKLFLIGDVIEHRHVGVCVLHARAQDLPSSSTCVGCSTKIWFKLRMPAQVGNRQEVPESRQYRMFALSTLRARISYDVQKIMNLCKCR